MYLRLSANSVTNKKNKVVNVSAGVSLEESSISGHKGEENFSYGKVSEVGIEVTASLPPRQLAEQKDIRFYESNL